MSEENLDLEENENLDSAETSTATPEEVSTNLEQGIRPFVRLFSDTIDRIAASINSGCKGRALRDSEKLELNLAVDRLRAAVPE
jgi:hypothetical protein